MVYICLVRVGKVEMFQQEPLLILTSLTQLIMTSTSVLMLEFRSVIILLTVWRCIVWIGNGMFTVRS